MGRRDASRFMQSRWSTLNYYTTLIHVVFLVLSLVFIFAQRIVYQQLDYVFDVLSYENGMYGGGLFRAVHCHRIHQNTIISFLYIFSRRKEGDLSRFSLLNERL